MNIHIGNLPPNLTEDELRAHFGSCGVVREVEIIINQRTNEPLGYGFVVMSTEEEGTKAITMLNGSMLRGKAIVVSKANRPTSRHRRPFQKKSPGIRRF